jgi:son of sevenless
LFQRGYLKLIKINSDVYGQKNSPKKKRTVRPEEVPHPILPKSMARFKFYDLDPLEIARQLTLVESSMFAKIQPIEMMKQEWSKKQDSLAINVRMMTAMSTKVISTYLDYRLGYL